MCSRHASTRVVCCQRPRSTLPAVTGTHMHAMPAHHAPPGLSPPCFQGLTPNINMEMGAARFHVSSPARHPHPKPSDKPPLPAGAGVLRRATTLRSLALNG